jgi:hypothetical protein
VIVIALEPAVNVPELVKLPANVNPKFAVASVLPLLMVKAPLTVVATPKDLVPVPEMVTL